MAQRGSWTGSATDLLRAGAAPGSEGNWRGRADWPKNPRAFADRLRRAQIFLRAVGIEVAFGREGRAGSRVIRMHTRPASTVSTVRSVRQGSRLGSKQPQPAGDVRDNKYCPDLVTPCSVGQASMAAADDTDGTDANAALRLG
jgi:hypothetical protein